MATYALGDLQGCYDSVLALLEHIGFDAGHDRLWLTGDLVNRGPRSLEVLRLIHGLAERAVTVLGNHDLHLLAIAAGARKLDPADPSLAPVLAAPDRNVLLGWLRRRPLIHHDAVLGYTLLHAGLPPQWDLRRALSCAAEVERMLQQDDPAAFLATMYGDTPDQWRDDLAGWERVRFITNCLTRMRYCDGTGRLALHEKGPIGSQPSGLLPWFEVPARASRSERIIFGHWSTLRLSPAAMRACQVYPLDTGCCWGERLTAMRLEDQRFFSVPCPRREFRTALASR